MSKQESERPRSMREIRRRMRLLEQTTRDKQIQSQKGFLFPIGFSGIVVNSEEIKKDLRKAGNELRKFLRKIGRRTQS